MKKVLILGATSGIGLALAEEYLKHGCQVLGAGRSIEQLSDIKKSYPKDFETEFIDIRDSELLDQKLQNAIKKLGGMDICVISSGISRRNRNLDWNLENDVIRTNVTGFSQVAIFAANYFKQQGSGHIVGISSIAKYFGNPHPAYNATKAFEAIYLDGLRLKLEHKNIFVTTLLPGFVETPMTEDQPLRFWSADVSVAARQMVRAIERKKRNVFVTRRWRIFSWIIPPLPFALIKMFLSRNR